MLDHLLEGLFILGISNAGDRRRPDHHRADCAGCQAGARHRLDPSRVGRRGGAVRSSGFLAVYLAGLVVGNRQTRAHNSVITFLDAVTWLARSVMFVLLGVKSLPTATPLG
jgi:hypothetical protein